MKKIIISLVVLLFSVAASAEPMTGRQIVDRARQNSSGFKDMTHKVRMVLIDENGDHSEREMLLKARVGEHGESSSLSIFTSPQREKGIALLTNTRKGKEDEQWLYLPSTKRMKRITGSSRTSSFRGSEFTFEDLSDQNPDAYRFEYVTEEACGQLKCYVVDRFPGPGLESSYSKTRLWFDSEYFRPLQADFYDKDGKEFKSMKAYDYRQYDNKYWNPSKVVMTNLQTKKATELDSLELEMNTGLKENDFTELAIRSWH